MTATDSTTAVRILDGSKVPEVGTWVVDEGHAEVGFWGRHFMVTKVRGRFRGVVASVQVAEDPQDSVVEASIDMASIESGDPTRENHLRSPDFFDVERWPLASYRSTSITWEGDSGVMVGDLTIKDVTHELTLDVSFLGAGTDPWGNDRAVFEASGVIDREDWGLTWNMPLEGGGLLVSKEIHLELNVELIRHA